MLLDQNMVHFPTENKHWRQGWFVVTQKGEARVTERSLFAKGNPRKNVQASSITLTCFTR